MSYGYKTSLKLGTTIYDAKAVSYAFDKGINDSGEVISPPVGGRIYLSLMDIPKKSILEWGIKPRIFRSGIIETTGIDGGKPVVEEEIEFVMGACINLKLVYERNYSNYFTTLLTISAEKICIGRSNNWIKKEWTFDEKETESDEIPDIEDFLPKDVAIDCTLHTMGKEYEIQVFETEFSQPDDWKGQPTKEVKGGLLFITLKQASDEFLNN